MEIAKVWLGSQVKIYPTAHVRLNLLVFFFVTVKTLYGSLIFLELFLNIICNCN